MKKLKPTVDPKRRFKGHRLAKPSDTPFVLPNDTPTLTKPTVDFEFNETDYTLSAWERMNKVSGSLLSPASDGLASAPLPSNRALVDRQATLSADLSADLYPATIKVREFILREVLPLISSVDYGHSDAVEVVEMALGEKPDTAAYYQVLKGLAREALTARTIVFIADLAKLTGEARSLFLLQHLPKDASSAGKSDLVDTLLQALNLSSPLPEPEGKRKKTKVNT